MSPQNASGGIYETLATTENDTVTGTLRVVYGDAPTLELLRTDSPDTEQGETANVLVTVGE